MRAAKGSDRSGMAGKSRSREEIEPSFSGRDRREDDEDDFALDDEDRIDGCPRKTQLRSIPPNHRAAAEPERKTPRQGASRLSVRAAGFSLAVLRRPIYWCIVLGIWAGIGVGRPGRLLRLAHAERQHLGHSRAPAERQDHCGRRQRDRQSRRHRRRGARAGRHVALHSGSDHRHRRPALLFAFRRRSARPGARLRHQPDDRPA